MGVGCEGKFWFYTRQALSVVFGARIKNGTFGCVVARRGGEGALGVGNAVFDDLSVGSTSVFQFTDPYT